MRLIPALLTFFLLSASAAGAVDIQSLGKPLDNDTTPMVDRYVYLNQDAIDKGVPIDRAILSVADIEDWLRQNVTDALALNGTDYDKKMALSQSHFTAEGYGYYLNSLEAASLPTLLKEQGYTLSAVVIDRPEITGHGLRDVTPKGTPADAPKQMQYVWLAKVPTLISYIKGQDVKSYNVVIEAEIVRVPIRDDGTKIAINAWRFASSTVVQKPEDKLPVQRTYEYAAPKSRFAF